MVGLLAFIEGNVVGFAIIPGHAAVDIVGVGEVSEVGEEGGGLVVVEGHFLAFVGPADGCPAGGSVVTAAEFVFRVPSLGLAGGGPEFDLVLNPNSEVGDKIPG